MEKLFLILVIAALSYEAFGMSYRQKRQNEEEEADLEDRWSWPVPGWLPNPGRRPQTARPIPVPVPVPSPRPVPNPTTTTTAAPTNIGNEVVLKECRRTCPVTSEYNPVCGTNGVTYNNPSRLFCDQACGVGVTLMRSSRCPTATVAPTA